VTDGGAVVGLLLAAGAGRRMGAPKALLRDPDGQAWVARAVRALLGGGCTRVLVVAGAEAEQVSAVVAAAFSPPGVSVVVAADWAQGMGASLRAGLGAVVARPAGADAVLIALVDTPGVGPEVVCRLGAAAAPSVLARAAYRGLPGHPVLIGRDHWDGVRAGAAGDAGARYYLAARRAQVRLVECGDVGDGRDLDTPADLDRA
jgi:nicotine blue oxidoreductase